MPRYAVRHQAAAPRSASEASQESSPHTPCEEPPPSTRPRAAWTGFANLAKPRLSGLHYSQRLHTARTQARAAPNKPAPHSAPSAANPCAAAPSAKPTDNSGAAPPTPTAKAPKTSKPRPSRPPPKLPLRPVRKVRPVRRFLIAEAPLSPPDPIHPKRPPRRKYGFPHKPILAPLSLAFTIKIAKVIKLQRIYTGNDPGLLPVPLGPIPKTNRP
jgi:hypothetical protein